MTVTFIEQVDTVATGGNCKIMAYWLFKVIIIRQAKWGDRMSDEQQHLYLPTSRSITIKTNDASRVSHLNVWTRYTN